MDKIRTWWRYSGILMIITSILHTLTALAIGGKAFADMLRAGVFNSVESDPARSFAFWFLIVGISPYLRYPLARTCSACRPCLSEATNDMNKKHKIHNQISARTASPRRREN
jgi:hypothetical protein